MSVYDEIADWYDGWIGSGRMREDPVFPDVEEMMGPVDGLRVCDLACGQGRVARHLADNGPTFSVSTCPRGSSKLPVAMKGQNHEASNTSRLTQRTSLESRTSSSTASSVIWP